MKTQRNPTFTFFAHYIENELGIVFSQNNDFQLENRLEEVCTLYGVGSIQELYQLAQQGISGRLKQLLLDVATNNETSFFRDQKYFDAFKKLLEQHLTGNFFSQQEIKIWSAASSTGQEALSMAIVMDELKEKFQHTPKYSILGTDISERALQKAKSATYSQLEIQRGLSQAQRQKYFTQDHAQMWRASSELTAHIEYRKLNLKSDDYPSDKFHFIFCRNVLIYQNVQNKIEILNKLEECLLPGGYLILGVGESLIGLEQDYEMTLIDNALIYRKKMAFSEVA